LRQPRPAPKGKPFGIYFPLRWRFPLRALSSPESKWGLQIQLTTADFPSFFTFHGVASPGPRSNQASLAIRSSSGVLLARFSKTRCDFLNFADCSLENGFSLKAGGVS